MNEDQAMDVGGILETALYVADVRRSADFYRGLFGFGALLETDRLIALDVAGRDVLLLFQAGATSEPFTLPDGGGVIPGHDGTGRNHFALSIAADDFEPWRSRLEAEGVAVESVVNWPGGCRSLYFRDPDGHLAELITPGFWRTY
jgi:catechol 2,3-dioxygenase-like lactoylglutathione lyase family enzyme